MNRQTDRQTDIYIYIYIYIYIHIERGMNYTSIQFNSLICIDICLDYHRVSLSGFWYCITCKLVSAKESQDKDDAGKVNIDQDGNEKRDQEQEEENKEEGAQEEQEEGEEEEEEEQEDQEEEEEEEEEEADQQEEQEGVPTDGCETKLCIMAVKNIVMLENSRAQLISNNHVLQQSNAIGKCSCQVI